MGLRLKERPAKNGGGPYLTDEGTNSGLCVRGDRGPGKIAAEIRGVVGVVEHGLFLGMAALALIAGETRGGRVA